MGFIEFEEVQLLLGRTVGANSIRDFVIAVGLFIVLLIAFRIFRRVLLRRIKDFTKKTCFKSGEVIVQTLENVHGWFYVVLALYFPIKTLALPSVLDGWVDAGFIVILILQVIVSVQFLMDHAVKRAAMEKGASENEAVAAFAGIRFVLRLVLWSIGILLILSNIGINVTSLIAGLGIGGVAVALAVQNILGDIFSSFSIYFDKPFRIGDFIIAGEHMGVVKKIGIKSTRLQALQGEEIVISNNELTSTRIQNFKQMRKRRVLLNFGVVYGTSVKKLKKANEIVEKAVKKIDGLTFDRCHFAEFGDFSLNFEAIYYVDSGDFSVYMEKQQAVNFEIKEKFEKEGIEIAFPTQTLHVKDLKK